MTREEQLTFCKRCSFRKMDLKQGLICNLRGQKADFENECLDFEVDKQVLAVEKSKAEKIRPNKKRAENAQLMIWIVLIFEILSIVSSYFQYGLLKRIERNEFIPDDVLEANDTREQVIAIFYLVIYIVSAITFIQWFRRAYYNLNIRSTCEHTENWTLLAWCIPIISIYRPYQIMKEMWTKTSKILQSKSEDFVANSTAIIGFWWLLWIISSYIGSYVMRTAFKAETIQNFINSTIADMVLSFLGIPLAIITVYMIQLYAQKEEKLAVLESVECK